MAIGIVAQLVERYEEELEYYKKNDYSALTLEAKWYSWNTNDIAGMIKFAMDHPRLAASNKLLRLNCLRPDINLIGDEIKLSPKTQEKLDSLASHILTFARCYAVEEGYTAKDIAGESAFFNSLWEDASAEMKHQFISSIFKLL